MGKFKCMTGAVGLMLQALCSTAAIADDQRVFTSNSNDTQLVELYTSQGCSSCPPADHWLTQWKQRPELWTQVIPIAFHVDYWDWIGWQDPFAVPEHGQRQRRYKQQGAIRSVYTPGFVVDGREWRGWFDGRVLPEPISKYGTLAAKIKADTIRVQYLIDPMRKRTSAPLRIQVALLGFDLETPVKRGENSNRTLREDFVVLWHQTAVQDSSWVFTLPKASTLPTTNLGFVAWVTAQGSSTPIQVVGGKL